MKISERFTPARPYLAGTSFAVARVALAALTTATASSFAGLNLASRLQPKLAFGNHCFASFDALQDDEILIDTRAGSNIPSLNRLIGLHDVYELPILAVLHRLIWNRDGIGLGGKPQRHIQKLSRP